MVLAVLLLISVSINIVAMVYCIYQWRVKLTQNVSGSGEEKVEEELYARVDDCQPEAVSTEQNEAYGESSSFTPNPSDDTTGL